MNYWPAIAERYGLDLTVTNSAIDPTFRFMTVDWDGKIRMDPSSPFAMASLLGLRDRFDVAVACDTDADRHGVVTPSAGLLNPNHYLAVMIEHLFGQRPDWSADAGVGKTVVSSSIIDAVAAGLGRRLVEVPVGFKWFVDGLLDGSIGFGGEESAGASFLRRDGQVWTTDKDGIIAALLAAEITARAGADPGELYDRITARYGAPGVPPGGRARRSQGPGGARSTHRKRPVADQARRRRRGARPEPCPRQRRPDRRHQGRDVIGVVRRRAPPAPRRSTSCTPKATAARSTSPRCSRRHSRWSTA